MRAAHAIAFLAASLSSSACCTFSCPPYRGPRSNHFDGERFVNANPAYEERTPLDLARWLIQRDPGPWPERFEPPGPKPPAEVEAGRLRATLINHSTVLVQMDRTNILTDPVWSDRVGPLSGVGPKRKRSPGVRFEDLPKIHVVLISHNHYDHLDLPTLKRLWDEHQPIFVVPLGVRELLIRAGIPKVRELDWWRALPGSPWVKVTAVPAQHFSNRGLCDRDRTLWAGYVVSGRAGHVYFAGDTGYGPFFKEIAERFSPIRLALLPIGAFRPRWFMRPVHIDPKEAVLAQQDLGATTGMGIHFGTFQQADDGMDEPKRRLERVMKRKKIDPERFWTLENGEGRDVP
jgi:L-ascorbate metabolism protein UlaG (beta-lactamase superfamily)